MKTITVYTDNSDHKMSQVEWCGFVNAIQGKIVRGFYHQGDTMRFHGASSSESYCLNAAWVFECSDESAAAIHDRLKHVAAEYEQEIVWIDGQMHVIRG